MDIDKLRRNATHCSEASKTLATTGDIMLPQNFERQSIANSQVHVQVYQKWQAIVSSVHRT